MKLPNAVLIETVLLPLIRTAVRLIAVAAVLLPLRAAAIRAEAARHDPEEAEAVRAAEVADKYRNHSETIF